MYTQPCSFFCWWKCYLYRIKYCSGKILYSFKTFSRTEVIIAHTQTDRHLKGLLDIMIKNPPANAGYEKDSGSILGSGRSSGVENGNPTPVFLPGNSHGQRSLVGYSPWGRKESDRTEPTQHAHTCLKAWAQAAKPWRVWPSLTFAAVTAALFQLLDGAAPSGASYLPFLPAFFPPTHTGLLFSK